MQPQNASADTARFGQFIFWTALAGFSFGIVEVFASAILGERLIGIAGGVHIGYGVCMFGVQALLRRGRMNVAVTISSLCLLGVMLLTAPTLPVEIPTLIVLSIMAIALALPYLKGREIRPLILAAWAVGVIIAILGTVLPPQSGLPVWLANTLHIGTVGAALGVTFLLLWQFTSRLNDMLAQLRQTNAALQIEITERQRAEEALHQLNVQLEQRVTERTVELRKNQEQLEQRVAERTAELRKSQTRLTRAQQVAQIGSWEWDIPNNVITWSDELFRVYGLRPQEFDASYEAFLQRLHPDDREFVNQIVTDAYANHQPFAFDHRIVRPDGAVRVLNGQGIVIKDEGGNPVWMFGTGQDITERKQVEAQLAASLKEKEVLLTEIHHRVKNNLQIISSLLRLQAGGIADPQMRDLFRESQQRVRAMALIHEQLYQSSNLTSIDFVNYVAELTKHLRNSYGLEKPAVNTPGPEFRVEIEDLPLDIEQAIPLGLIINELVSNSLKHAFPGGQEGQLWVTLTRAPAGGLKLVVGDTGVGLPDGLDLQHPPSLGLQLVTSLVTQLQGHLTYTGPSAMACPEVRGGGTPAMRTVGADGYIQPPPSGTVFTLTLPERTPGHG